MQHPKWTRLTHSGGREPTLGRRGFLLAALATLASPGCASIRPADRRVALTIDDLPYVPTGFSDAMQAPSATTERLLAALAAHRAPALGLVNAGRRGIPLDEQRRLLRDWARRGVVLGNHTANHVDLNTASVAQFIADVEAGAGLPEEAMAGRGPYRRYFRFPYNHTGPTEAVKAEVEAHLAAMGYTIAPHTIDTADHIFNLPYAESVALEDDEARQRIGEAYVAHVLAATTFAETAARKVLGRAIPHIMLLHASDLNADWLDAMLRGMQELGYRFITMDAAMADPAYRTRDTLVTRFGPTWLWRWRVSLGLDVSFAGDPEPPAWILERYARVARTPEEGGRSPRQ